MSAQGTEPAVPAGNHDNTQRWRGRRIAAAGVLLLLVVVVVGLELWEKPPDWLQGGRQVVVDTLHWMRVHWATSGALGVIATLVVFGLQHRAERRREQREQERREEAARIERVQQAKAVEDAQRRLLAANCWLDETTGWLPRVGQVTDPVALGVHPAAEVDELDAEGQGVDLPAKVPVYVPRDKDAELDAKLARGGLVLVVGDSTAGKSRGAYEAIHRLFGQRFLLVPNRRGSLQALLDGGIELRETVVWLNDLERWLGPDGLDLGLLRRLLGDGHRQVVVVATMRASEYAARTLEQEPGRSDSEGELRRIAREVLDQATRVELARRFTGPERERAEQRAWDPRIADALAHAGGYGLAEYIAAGPRLWQRWRDALAVDNPPERLAGAAIVAVAVDCRRAGLVRPVPEALLQDLYLAYLDTPVTRQLGQDAFAAGLAWAAKPVQATSALLVQDEQGYVAFDYLIDRVQADPDAPPVPDATWIRVLREAGTDEAMVVGFVALFADRPHFAEQAWRKVAEVGRPDGEYNLGLLLERLGDLSEAEEWYRKAASAGHHFAATNLGLLLNRRGDLEEAEQWYRKAADVGDHNAENNLAMLLNQQGRAGEAEQWWRKAATAGHQAAAVSLGTLLALQGYTDEAEQWWRKAAATGHHAAEYNLGALLAKQGRTGEAEQWYRKAVEMGDHDAENGLALLLAEKGYTGEAERLWRRAANAGHHDAEHNLGLLLADKGRTGEAEQWLRKAASAGRHDAEYNLGLLLYGDGRTEEAEQWWRRAADAIDVDEEVAARAQQMLRNIRQYPPSSG